MYSISIITGIAGDLFVERYSILLYMIHRIIPSTGEPLPALGLGTWQTFDTNEQEPLQQVLGILQQNGGSLIDSSPMYGKAEKVIGNITSQTENRDQFFYATKVWTTGLQEGILQMNASFDRMQRTVIDLMQIHNLVDWKIHLTQLRKWKEEGKIRYIGITHYKDTSHNELETIIRSEQPDFVQFNYSIVNRHAEKTLLQTAADHGVATIINRPFGEGSLFKMIAGKSLPGWAIDAGISSWPVYLLKYILSHPAVTCIIPATHNPFHATQNYTAGDNNLPGDKMRKQMVGYIESIL